MLHGVEGIRKADEDCSLPTSLYPMASSPPDCPRVQGLVCPALGGGVDVG